MRFLHSTYVLTKKNCLLSFRDVGPLLITILSALFSMLVLYFSQISIDNGDSFDPSLLDTPQPQTNPITTIPRCVPLAFDDCFTLAFTPNVPRVTEWVDLVASNNQIPPSEIRSFESSDQLNSFLVNNPNRTQAAYVFESDTLQTIDEGNVEFIVQYNETRQFEFPLGSTDFHTQVVLPAMIHHMNLVLMPNVTGKTFDITLDTSVFPHPNIVSLARGGAGLDAFSQYGPLLIFATYFLVLVFFLYNIVIEKERGLRDAMKLAGQYQSQHYISWCLPFLVLDLLMTVLLIAFGHAFGFKYFTVNDFSVYFLTLFTFALSLIGWTMLIATIIRRSTAVSLFAFNLFILGYILATSGSIVYSIDQRGDPLVSESVFFLRELFAIFPSTMFVKALTDGSILAQQGGGLTFELAGTYSDIFPIKKCWSWMVVSGLIALLLSLYLDNVLPSEHGVPLSPFYFVQPSYWGIGRRTAPNFDGDSEHDTATVSEAFQRDGVQAYNPDEEDQDVRKEREAVARGERDTAALLIKNVSKNFGKFTAVDDVSFSVKKNTAFALLGHNGAGKSTLLKMIVTSLRPSAGDVFIYGLSTRHNQSSVRGLLGVCPQFDIYWDKLTGAEHIEVFAALKGLRGKERENEILNRLDDVELTEKKDIYAGSYSGGMQRRLSVAMSLTGDPKILLLDECTSGADPLVRRDLWRAIERAKKGRVIFLITHSIAEAQHLAGHNSIGIMAKGKLRVLGDALHLKKKFGAGFKILVALRNEESALALAEALNSVCPGTSLLSGSDGENGKWLAEYEMNRLASEAQVLEAVLVLENRQQDFNILDYSINSTTLGEVFRSITSLSEDVHEEEYNKKSKKRFCF